MKNIFKYIAVILFITAFTSCETEEGYEDYTVERTSVIDMTGDWYIQTFFDGDLVLDYELVTLSNTAADNGEIQIFDDHIWPFTAKVPVDLNNLTFSGNDLADLVSDGAVTVTITNGVIVKNGTTSSGLGVTTNSISFDAEFSDDPGSVYHFEGYKRTGFLEDEH